MTTGKLAVRGLAPRNAALGRTSSHCESSRTILDNALQSWCCLGLSTLSTGTALSRSFNSKNKTCRAVAATRRRRTTEYPANGSPSLPTWKKRNMVKPHGSLVPVSLTHRCASTPGLSTWSSTRSLQRDYSLGDLISWRVSRLDAFSVSPFRT